MNENMNQLKLMAAANGAKCIDFLMNILVESLTNDESSLKENLLTQIKDNKLDDLEAIFEIINEEHRENLKIILIHILLENYLPIKKVNIIEMHLFKQWSFEKIIEENKIPFYNPINWDNKEARVNHLQNMFTETLEEIQQNNELSELLLRLEKLN